MKPALSNLLVSLVLSWITNCSALPLIDTAKSWNGSSFFDWFGVPDSRYFGQTFVTEGGATKLDKVTVYIKDCWGFECADVPEPQGAINFSVSLVPWVGGNPSNQIGTPIASFGTFSTTNNSGAGGFEAFGIDAGGFLLEELTKYLIYFEVEEGSLGRAVFGRAGVNVDSYTSGGFTYRNFGYSPGYWYENTDDLAMRFEFSRLTAHISEPNTAWLVLLSMTVIPLVQRVRYIANCDPRQ